jgi:hypothetical protein
MPLMDTTRPSYGLLVVCCEFIDDGGRPPFVKPALSMRREDLVFRREDSDVLGGRANTLCADAGDGLCAMRSFDTDAFTIDWDALTAVCPQGHANTWSGNGIDRHGKPRVMFTFSLTHCTPCPVRSRCTRAKTAARTITLRPREQHELLRDLRAEQQTEQWRQRYAARSGVEGTISQAVRAFGLRRCRYKGIAKTRVQNILTATAINLTRVDAWLAGNLLGRNRISHLAALTIASRVCSLGKCPRRRVAWRNRAFSDSIMFVV